MAEQDLQVTIHLRDLNEFDTVPSRSIVLKAPTWSIKVGRGSTNGDEELRPAKENAWFDSKVMSRNHAVLKADPKTRMITLKDVGSMHGTKLGTERITAEDEVNVYHLDLITFGSDVSRGSSYFPALEVEMEIEWSDDKRDNSLTPSVLEIPQDVFENDGTLPDQREVQATESIQYKQPKDTKPPRTFSVPESDISDDISYASEADSDVSKSMSSSILGNEQDQPTADDIEKVENPAKQHPNRHFMYFDDELMDEEDDDELENELEVVHEADEPSITMKQTNPINYAERVELADMFLDMEPANSSKSPPFPARAARPDTFASDQFRHSIWSWAGHNSVLHEPMPLSFYPSSNNHIGTNNFDAGAFPTFLNDRVANPTTKPAQTSEIPWPLRTAQDNTEAKTLPRLQRPHLPKADEKKPSEPFLSLNNVRFPGQNDKDNNPPRPVTLPSVHDLLNPFNPGTKRKVDHMVASDDVDNSHLQARTENPSKIEHSAEITVIKSVEVNDLACSCSEPAKKKRKQAENPKDVAVAKQGTGFGKIVTATIVGAAVGAVGTIFGLAALPQDFFV